jgi:hypothetical protein
MRINAKALIALVACVVIAGSAFAATVTVNQAAMVNGYMNVYELDNTYLWGSGWGIADLCAVFSSGNVTLSPNTIGDPAPYWYIGGGAAGNPGNKLMYADLYAQVDDGSLAGQSVTFTGTVLSNTFTSAHVSKAFVRDFAPDYSSFNQSIVNLPASGDFSVTLATVGDPARHVQYGFETIGACVWFTDVAQFGSAIVAPLVPVDDETTTFGGVKALFR